jgi:hypothetical protein
MFLPVLSTTFPDVAGTNRAATSPSRSAVRRSRSTATTQKKTKRAPTAPTAAVVRNVRRKFVKTLTSPPSFQFRFFLRRPIKRFSSQRQKTSF